MADLSYIIIGSGVFGASTALHLIRKYPNAHVRLIDRDAPIAPTRVAASWDWNKVVRADYNDVAYTKLALEAQEVWRNDALWRDYYHEAGVFWMSKAGFAEKVIANFQALQKPVEGSILSHSVEEAKTLHGGVFADADHRGIRGILVNKTSGWADAKDALQHVILAAMELGVEYVQAEVATLDLEKDGQRCKGVRCVDGRHFEADRIVLSTGAYTAKLLADSAPSQPSFHAGNRIIAAGVSEAIAPLSSERLRVLADMPVAINESDSAEAEPRRRLPGASTGCLPPNKDGVLKFWGPTIFKNTMHHAASGQDISVPPAGSDYGQWNLSDYLKDDVRFARNAILGKLGQGVELEKFRMCWEALTPSEDFIISPHSQCASLYIATCGSFHGFKFFPILGKYVVEMLDGQLEPSLMERWAWDRDIPGTEANSVWPRSEWKDLMSA